MADYPIVSGRSSFYPAPGESYGGHFHGATATFFMPGDFQTLGTNALAIPNLPITSVKVGTLAVTNTFFGMSVKDRANDALTGVTASVVRSHDLGNGQGRWQFIEPSDNVWNFTDLDLWVNAHYAAGRDIIFTLFATPGWASARPSEPNAYSYGTYGTGTYGNFGIAAEPTDMTKWDRYCNKIITRYLGKIKYFEVWNEPNFNNNGTTKTGDFCFFSGSYAKLSELTRRANVAIKAVDATAKIICPPVQGWAASGTDTSGTYFTGMMAAATGDGSTTMKDWVDIIGVHLYPPTPNRVIDIAGAIDRVNTAKTTAGVSAKETWDTESGPIGGDVMTLTEANAKAVIGRMLIIMAAKGVARTIYYQYDHATMGYMTLPAVATERERIVTLLKSGTIQAVSKFTDGRIAYYTDAAYII